jgi:2-keto-3-deoxy-L-rhamnonate aldolase RhmA
MFTNPVKKALLDRTITVGTWLQIPHPGIAEVFANTPYDWITLDCEHSEAGPAEFVRFARAVESRATENKADEDPVQGKKPLPFVRVKENDTMAIRQMLDLGAWGVFVPLVNSAGEARRAVAAAKYPPQGVRGFAYYRANDYGEHFSQYVEQANDNIAVIIMIESREGVENIDDILAVEGVDGVFLGPYDMSGSYGIVGQIDHPTIVEAKQHVLEACKRAGKSAGLHVVLPTEEQIRGAIDDGFTLIAVGMDDIFLDRAAKEAYEFVRRTGKIQ